ncbi:MAG: RNA 2',3'-cyclic phosphodiesterase [Candidatus Aenigmarchaeota archaeon]|nr:RNA 2',3'-cyclic phosphodiesterase [Candidatus Aenigmarchaeota archaeon]
MANRCFLAIDINDHVKVNVKVTQGHVKYCGGDVKLVEPENLHFTVKFLGNLTNDQVKRVIDALTILLKSETSSKVSVRGIGFFGPSNAPKVIWAGIGDGKPYLEGLFGRISGVVKGICPKNDEKEGIPHITIARVKSIRNINKLEEIILKESETFFGETLVDAVKLKASVLTPTGPRYSDIAVFPLKKP